MPDLRDDALDGDAVGVIVVADDPLVRRALHDALAPEPELDVLDEVASGAEAVRIAQDRHPEVVVMDVDMPDLDGITATLRLHRHHPDARVILLSTVPDSQLGLLALRAGVHGFLGKETDVDALVRAVRGVAHGEAAISRSLTLEVVECLRRTHERPAGMRPVRSPLTTREWEVLDLMSTGASTDEMADRLVLSIETVRSHVKHILAKLDAHSRAEAVARAAQWRAPQGSTAEEAEERSFQRELDAVRRRLRDQR